MSREELVPQDRAMDDVPEALKTYLTSPSPTPSRKSSGVGTNENAISALPPSAYYIIIVEGCERFCYYGLRAILLLYFMYFIGLDKNMATAGYHLFTFGCYFTPTLGAIIADGFIGRYLTLLTHSIIYFIGTAVLTITAVPQLGYKKLVGPAIGLLLIAYGIGGVKPCINTFGADQIPASNTKQLDRYFSAFYVALCAGSLISVLITPLLRSDVQCFEYDCYSLGFGVPSAAMLIAIVIFAMGTPLYKRVPPKDNIIAQFVAIIWRAMRNAISSPSTSQRKEHWLYYADDKYSTTDIEDVRRVLRICVILLPIPIYQSLYEQRGSRWTYQASLMDGSLAPFGKIQPDQMQALSSLLVLLFIPFFDSVLYPAAARFNFFIRPLQRIYFGMIMMFFAFVAAAMLQNAIHAREDAVPVRRYTDIYNGFNCSVNINNETTLAPGKVYQYACTKLLGESLFVNSTCDENALDYKLSLDEICPSVLIISHVNETMNDTTMNGTTMELTTLTNPISRTRGVQEFALLRMVSLDDVNRTVKTSPNEYTYNIDSKLIPTEYQSVFATRYKIENIDSGQSSIDSFDVYTTAVYTVLVTTTQDNELRAIVFEDVPPFTVHMLWQIIQYIFLSIAEIFVNVTGLSFVYSQAPKRYKAVIMSAWLFTVAIGNLLVVLVAGVSFTKSQTAEFAFFAVLMAFATFIFGVLASNYKEGKPNDEDPTEDEQLIKDKNIPIQKLFSSSN